MRTFIKKIVIFIFLIWLCFCGIVAFGFFVIGSQYETTYQASLIDKVSRLESIEEPKIILVGNSNLAFGINSQMIENAFGMPVVNMGLNGGLGNAFHEEMAKLNINEGDIVVVCHTSFSDTDEIEDRALAWRTIDNNIEIGKILRTKEYFSMFIAYSDYFRDAAFLWVTHAGNREIEFNYYRRSAFNEYGDLSDRSDSWRMDADAYFVTAEVPVPEINNVCTDRLNRYNQYVMDQGASLVIAGYPIAYGEYADFDEKDFRIFQTKLQEMLDCEVISDYTDYFYPYDLFFDTSRI